MRVGTAEEMARAVLAEADGQDLFIAAAAVSDYRPKSPSKQKLKKGDGEESLVLARNPDILATLGERLSGAPHAPVLVGFAAETQDVIQNARDKLKRKRCDLVVANAVGRPGSGFGSDRNRVTMVGRTELAEIEGSKEAVAEAILDWVIPILDARRPRAR
jgi:phosphopantothenoylcysteine decarboxylase/phosphopantothenate--cysteine ligase